MNLTGHITAGSDSKERDRLQINNEDPVRSGTYDPIFHRTTGARVEVTPTQGHHIIRVCRIREQLGKRIGGGSTEGDESVRSDIQLRLVLPEEIKAERKRDRAEIIVVSGTRRGPGGNGLKSCGR